MQVSAAAGAAFALDGRAVSQQNPPILGHGVGAGGITACRCMEEEQRLCRVLAQPRAWRDRAVVAMLGAPAWLWGKVFPQPDPGEDRGVWVGYLKGGARGGDLP